MWLAALAAAGLAGCDDASGPTVRDLAGIWGAVEYEYISDTDPGTTEDLVHDLGGYYTITLSVNGTYQQELSTSGGSGAAVTESGTFELGNSQLTLSPSGGTPRTYTFTFDQIFLTLRSSDVSYDFGGGPEPASVRILLDRF